MILELAIPYFVWAVTGIFTAVVTGLAVGAAIDSKAVAFEIHVHIDGSNGL